MSLTLRTTAVNRTCDGMIGEDSIPVADSIFADDLSAGELYRFGLHEYGRCTGRVYVDPPNGGEPLHVGYVFEARRQYEDAPGETYLHETWLDVADVETRADIITPYDLEAGR